MAATKRETPRPAPKHPPDRQVRPAMEACGIDVFATVRRHGFTVEVVRDYEDPQHYFGLVLIE